MSVIFTHSVNNASSIETLIQSADSLPMLLQHLPTPYRAVLGRLLQEYFRVSQKLSSAQAALASFKKHQTEGTFPPPVLQAVKVPPVQYSKEFENSGTSALTKESIETLVKETRKEFLTKLIEGKTSEVSTLQTILVFDEKTWKAECRRVLGDMCTTMGLENAVSGEGDKVTFTDRAPNDMQTEFQKVHQYRKRWYLRTLSLAYSVVERSVVRKMAKVTLKDQTDTAMTDAPLDKPVREVVKEELKSALADLRKDLGKGNVRKTKPSNKKPGPQKPKGSKKSPPKKKDSSARVNKPKNGKRK